MDRGGKSINKQCDKEVKLAFKAMGEAICRMEKHAIIPFVNNGKAENILLADLIVKKLKREGFNVYSCSENNGNTKYCIACSKIEDLEISSGFSLI